MKSEGVVEGGTGARHMQNCNKKKLLIVTNHSYMLYRFRKELIQRLMEDYEVVISTPFVGHEEDLQELGAHCIETEVDRRSVNPVTDLRLLRTYKKILKREKPDLVITYSIKPNIYAGYLCGKMRIPFYANVQGLGTAFQKPLLSDMVTVMYWTALRKVEKVILRIRQMHRSSKNVEFCLRKKKSSFMVPESIWKNTDIIFIRIMKKFIFCIWEGS